MPKRTRKIKSIREIEQEDLSPEVLKLRINRLYRFKELLGEDFDEDKLKELTKSSMDYWELSGLLQAGCPPDLAIDILS
jgi:hypothetical protein